MAKRHATVQQGLPFASLPTPAVIQGDCMDVLRELPDNFAHAVITDPPYGLLEMGRVHTSERSRGFMRRNWDGAGIERNPDLWREVRRVVRPGGYVLAFSSARTVHRMMTAMEMDTQTGEQILDIRDQLYWIYSSGVPKGNNFTLKVDKLTDKAKTDPNYDGVVPRPDDREIWAGWANMLKPAVEPIVMARCPLDCPNGHLIENTLQHGTGGLNLEGCKVLMDYDHENNDPPNLERVASNVLHDGSDEVRDLFPGRDGIYRSAARFYYCVKPDQDERAWGLEGWEKKAVDDGIARSNERTSRMFGSAQVDKENSHPTVKPRDLMAYLCRLVCPPGGTVLDCFAGSGSTGIGALMEGVRFVGIEREQEYADIAAARLHWWCRHLGGSPPDSWQDLLVSTEDVVE